MVTFFDGYFAKVIKRLIAARQIHGWDLNSPLARSPEHAGVFQDLAWLSRHIAAEERGRLVPYGVRREDERALPASEIGSLELMMSQGVKGCLSWKGKPLFKTVYDFALAPLMLWELKPATIFEIGSGVGVSAKWYADLAREFGLPTRIYSADIEPVTDTCPGVDFSAGDCNNPPTLFGAALLASAPKPWLVVEDAHVNVESVLRFLHRHLSPGDYLMIEDSGAKVRELDEFMEVNGRDYAVDTRYTDFFGRNATSAQNAILRRVERSA